MSGISPEIKAENGIGNGRDGGIDSILMVTPFAPVEVEKSVDYTE